MRPTISQFRQALRAILLLSAEARTGGLQPVGPAVEENKHVDA